MATTRDILIIGGGHNGLVTAAYLAKAGMKPLVLESRLALGGAARTEELAPGFRCPTLAHAGGPFEPKIIADLGLAKHGVEWITPAVRAFAPDPDGKGFCLYDDAERTATELSKLSTKDAAGYREFRTAFERIGKVLGPILRTTPPSIDKPSAADALAFLKVGKNFRGLGKRDAYRLLRWGPMAVADLVSEFFETDLLRATVAARGIYGSFAGPWSAGTALPLLLQAALDGQAVAPAQTVRGGLGALSDAIASAAKSFGAEVRTGAPVAGILVKENRAVGVVLESGEEIHAKAVVSNADPKRTFLELVDPGDLDPDFAGKISNFRTAGVTAKVNYALSGLPDFSFSVPSSSSVSSVAASGGHPHLAGRIHIGPGIDYLEKAFDASKYGEFSTEPYLDCTIPTVSDPSLAPAGSHVMSVTMQFAPYKLKAGDWAAHAEALGDTVSSHLSTYAPNFASLVVNRQVLTPADLESSYGLTGGHVLHGETTIDQFLTFRPLLGWSQYRTPIDALYLCGAGTHPGGGVTGLPGANASREILKDRKKLNR
ncbi:MAG: NAD(P)/FAD-dependent oxidoreductase [Acidobacteria bacterium]|nr:NAD(P)/FAD-dependent oxidoreductase [Acidobacteriota bacterium]